MRRRKNGVLWFLCFVAMIMLTLPGISEAKVTFVPRVNSAGQILQDEAGGDIADEDYVLLGKYRHSQMYSVGSVIHYKNDAEPTPVVWRVMRVNPAQGGAQAILLSHYALEQMSYQHAARSDSEAPINQWAGSEVQTWLNSENDKVKIYQEYENDEREPGDGSREIKGFLHEDYFSEGEKAAMLVYPGDEAGGRVALPSLWTYTPLGNSTTFVYEGELSDWFGENDYTYSVQEGRKFGPNSIARRVRFKNDDRDLWYWTRSPFVLPGDNAWAVWDYGALSSQVAHAFNGHIRPVLCLDLAKPVFKSACGFLQEAVLGFLPDDTARAGTLSNPYILLLETGNGYGLPNFKAERHDPQTLAIDGDALVLAWAGDVGPALGDKLPHPGDFTLKRADKPDAHPKSVALDASDDKKIVLTFGAGTLAAGATLDYNLNFDAILFAEDETGRKVVASFAGLAVPGETTEPNPGGDGDNGGGGGAALSNVTKPAGVSAATGEAKHDAGLQPDGRTYLIIVPYGTNISNLTIDATLPSGATSDPKLPAAHDFTAGPFVFTVTAQDGKTKVAYTVSVRVESAVAPTERALFTIDVTDCEISVVRNEDGTLSVIIRIPFAAGANPALLDTIRMIGEGFAFSNVSYVWIDAEGNETPVARMKASAPYLEIRGTAANIDAIVDGVITKIEYTLKGDATQYVQTFASGGLKITGMPGYPTTPTPASNAGGGSGGCGSGLGGFAVMSALLLAVARRSRRAGKRIRSRIV